MVTATGNRLLPGPLAGWLERQLRDSSRTELARRLGVDRRQLSRWLDADWLPTIRPVDRALTRAGVNLGELYGDLAPIPERDRKATCPRCRFPMIEPAPLCGFCIEELDEAGQLE